MMVTTGERMARLEEKVDNINTSLNEFKDYFIGEKGFVGKTNKDIEEINLKLAKQQGIISTLKFVFGGGILMGIVIGVIKIISNYVA